MNTRLKHIIIFFTAISFVLVLAKSFYYTEKTSGVDLRHHIIASRLLGTAHSPYLYKPEITDGDYFLEGHKSNHKTGNGTTVTPAVLFMFYPLSLLPYKAIRIIWMFMQFIFLALSIWPAIKNKQQLKNNFLPLILVVSGLVCSNVWLMHIERGQVYIFYAFLIALSYWSYQSERKYSQLLSGFIAGILIFIRPLAGVIIISFLLYKKQRWIYGWLAGIVAGCILFAAPRPALWKDYFTSMQGFANEYTIKDLHADTVKIEYHNGSIEGMNNLQAYSLFTAGNMDTFHNYLEMTGFNITLKQSLIVYGIIAALLSFFFYKKKSRLISADLIFLFGFLLYILSELFILAPRSAYCVIEWVLPLYIISSKFQRSKTFIAFIIVSLLLMHGFPFVFPFQFDIAEFMLVCLLMYTIFNDILPERLMLK